MLEDIASSFFLSFLSNSTLFGHGFAGELGMGECLWQEALQEPVLEDAGFGEEGLEERWQEAAAQVSI